MGPFVCVSFTYHNSAIVLAYEDASAVMVVRHARAWSYRRERVRVVFNTSSRIQYATLQTVCAERLQWFKIIKRLIFFSLPNTHLLFH